MSTDDDEFAEAAYDALCGLTTLHIDEWKDQSEYQKRNLRALAAGVEASVRKRIADQIRDYPDDQNDSLDQLEGVIIGMSRAESIARGNTK